jgi:tRNA(Ser,Leu) C12 N-acetylase TAN1
MRDWNVVVTVHGKAGFDWACELLAELGRVGRTDYYNVLVMKVPDQPAFMAKLAQWMAEGPTVSTYISRVMPAQCTFDFGTVEQFETKARDIARSWAARLAGKSFHVRLHRRGFKGRLSTPEEERFLDAAVLEALAQAGTPGSITFDDPDAVIMIETVGNRAGLSLWQRDERRRYPFLPAD